jgi:hypothetical protein
MKNAPAILRGHIFTKVLTYEKDILPQHDSPCFVSRNQGKRTS